MNPSEVKKIRKIREEDAVSPVIATILMVAITVVLAGTLYVWAANLAESNTGDTLDLYSFSSRDSVGSPSLATDDNLAIVTMSQGDPIGWASLSIRVSVDGGSSFNCALPGQGSGDCIVLEAETSDGGLWSVGEDITIKENGLDLCNADICELKITIINTRSGNILGSTTTESEQGGDAVALARSVTLTVGPDGTVIQIQGAVISIPQGALSVDTELTFEALTASDLFALGDEEIDGYSIPTTFLMLTPLGTSFSQPVTVALGVTDSIPTTPVIYTKSDDNGDWEEFTGQLNTGINTITFEIYSFSYYFGTSATADDVNRISYWGGKVNQHFDNGVWATDPDGASGANIDKLQYCQKWWPDTVSVQELPERESIIFYDAGNSGYFPTIKPVFECVSPDDGTGGGDGGGGGDPNACNVNDDCLASGYCLNGACVYDDQDMDGISDNQDNCPNNANANQLDTDGDSVGDTCDSTPFGPLTTYYQDADSDTYGDPTQITEAYNQPVGYVTNSDDCNDQDSSLNLLNSVGNCAPEPQPQANVVGLTQTNQVNIVNSGGTKYVFNSNTYDDTLQYGLGLGTYTLANIPQSHPVAILNSGVSEISYSGDNSKMVTMSVTGSDNDATYDFYYGDVVVTVTGDFGTISIYCTHHGYMGGQDLFVYGDEYEIADTTAPVITVVGNNPETIEVGSTYIDTGATSDGGETITTTGTVDTSTPGTYTIIYSASDASGNQATATRTVNVVDTTGPVIQLIGASTVTIEVGSTYTDAGATSDGGETIITTGTVDTSTPGIYTITYSATDASGNQATATRTVNVVDTTDPAITVLGNNPETVEVGSTYNDAGATSDGGETVTTTGTVNTNIVDVYTITYTVTDVSGNQATATRTVNVVDTTGPVIQLVGASTVTIEVGTAYVDAGATAVDNYDGDLTSSIITTNNVDSNTIGTYSVTYDVMDASGNQAVQESRTVSVTTAPNNPPTLNSVSLTPISATVTSTMVCSPVGASDSDGDSITYGYAWYVNGQAVSSTSSALSGAFSKGDSVSCTITPNDGTEDGSTVTSNSVTIQNSAPVINSVTISYSSQQHSSGTFAGDQLTCNPAGTSDVDGDSLTLSYTWYLNGASHSNGQSLDTSNMNSGDVVYCSVIASDGTTNSASVSSASTTVYTIHSINIQNMAFSPSTITITAGDIIIWTNLDNMGHTVTEDSSTAVFDSGIISNSQTYTLVGIGVGTYTYHCQPHPSMTGTIIVQ